MSKKIFIPLLLTSLFLVISACDSDNEPISTSLSPSPNTPILESVEDLEVTIPMTTWTQDRKSTEQIERTGIYTGTVLSGIPNGNGKFETANSNGDTWYYEGEFSDGTFNGTGSIVWSDGYAETGRYIGGLFSPITSELYSAIGFGRAPKFSLQDTSIEMLDMYQKFFPCTYITDKDSVMELVDSTLTYKQLTKNISANLSSLYYSENEYVVSALEFSRWGHTETYLLTADSDMNFSSIYYGGPLSDIYDESIINFCGLPVSTSSFSNVSGGTTNVVVFIANFVELSE